MRSIPSFAAKALATQMQYKWQLTLLWGLLVGSATGVTAVVLAVVVANRWFEQRRGLVLGLLSAANATGQLVFLPIMARSIEVWGWRSAALAVAGLCAVVFLLAALFMRDRPEDKGLKAYGRQANEAGADKTSHPLEPPCAETSGSFTCLLGVGR